MKADTLFTIEWIPGASTLLVINDSQQIFVSDWINEFVVTVEQILFLEYQFKLYQRDESLLLIFALSHIYDPRSLVSFSLHYGIPAVSTIKLVNNLSECKHSTLLLLNPVRLKQYNTILPICFIRGRKPLLSGVEEMGRGERAFL